MITKFKKFFNKEKPIKIGTYVIVEPDRFAAASEDQLNFVRNNVGQVIRILTKRRYYNYKIKYTKVPKNLLGGYLHKAEIKGSPVVMLANISQITHFSDNKEELEIILDQKKYNL